MIIDDVRVLLLGQIRGGDATAALEQMLNVCVGAWRVPAIAVPLRFEGMRPLSTNFA